MSQRLEPVTTTWEDHFTNCQKCYETRPSKTWPVPAGIRNELRSTVENQLRANCSSGGGINVGPIALPPVPTVGNLISVDPPNWCIADHIGPQVICGRRCGRVSDRKNIKSTYDRFGTKAPCRDLSSDTPYRQRQVCSGAPKTIGSGPRQTITATYEVHYGAQITSGPCQGTTASATRTFQRTYQGYTYIRIRGKGYINYYRKKHCCRGKMVVNC